MDIAVTGTRSARTRQSLKAVWAGSNEPIPASYWVAAATAGLLVMVCYASAWWVPWFIGDMYDSVSQLYRVFGTSLMVVFGATLGVFMGAVPFLALRWPWFAIAVALLPALPTLVDPGTSPLHFGVIAALGAVAVTAGWRRPAASVAALVVAAVVACLWLVSAVDLAAPFRAGIAVDYYGTGRRLALGAIYLLGLLVVLGVAVGLRVSAGRELERRSLVARSGEVEAHATVVGERARLARDLHDVVAHHVSLIAVRAETAPYTHPDLDPVAREILTDIAADARLALDELRGVLGILGRAADSVDRSPQPSWGDITALVERSRSAGADIALEGDLSATVGAAEGYVAYRVVQEALTNARKHAPGQPARVLLEATGGLLVVRVSTSGCSGDRPDVGAPSDGIGLIGMRERVEAVGGRLVVGRHGDHFVVEATVPRVGAMAAAP